MLITVRLHRTPTQRAIPRSGLGQLWARTGLRVGVGSAHALAWELTTATADLLLLHAHLPQPLYLRLHLGLHRVVNNPGQANAVAVVEGATLATTMGGATTAVVAVAPEVALALQVATVMPLWRPGARCCGHPVAGVVMAVDP